MRKITDLINKVKDKKEANLPYGSDECGKFLKATYKNSVSETVFLNEELYEKFEEYDDIVENIGKLEVKKKMIEHMLQSEIKFNETAFCKERKVTWKSVAKNTVDTKRLKADYPELVEGYMKTSTSRMFKIK
ncbi:MAG: hypothetical protein ACRC3Y_05215 [Romboutsia sp.]|uniref:hypothetical protein n=1 Tax=Romboutsia sp. TaxID=1965302 RepID=UPI003F2E57D5